MATNLLTEQQYIATMSSGMATNSATTGPATNIWPYVQQLTADDAVLSYVYDRKLVAQVYRSNDDAFDHILLPANDENIFVVIVVDLKDEKVYGHYLLNMNREYER